MAWPSKAQHAIRCTESHNIICQAVNPLT
jgi:hypothetical protein